MASYSQPAVITSSGQVAPNSIEQSDLADDAVGLAELEAGTAGALLGFDASGDPAELALGTSGQKLTSAGVGAVPTWEDDSAATILSILPRPDYFDFTPEVSGTLSGNTNLYVCRVVIPFAITPTKLHLAAQSRIGAAYNIKYALYSEDGQTQIFTGTLAQGTGPVTITATISPGKIAAGIYYFAVLHDSAAGGTMWVWDMSNTVVNTSHYILATGIAGKHDRVGIITVTASTIPGTIDPTAITASADAGHIFRLDA